MNDDQKKNKAISENCLCAPDSLSLLSVLVDQCRKKIEIKVTRFKQRTVGRGWSRESRFVSSHHPDLQSRWTRPTNDSSMLLWMKRTLSMRRFCRIQCQYDWTGEISSKEESDYYFGRKPTGEKCWDRRGCAINQASPSKSRRSITLIVWFIVTFFPFTIENSFSCWWRLKVFFLQALSRSPLPGCCGDAFHRRMLCHAVGIVCRTLQSTTMWIEQVMLEQCWRGSVFALQLLATPSPPQTPSGAGEKGGTLGASMRYDLFIIFVLSAPTGWCAALQAKTDGRRQYNTHIIGNRSDWKRKTILVG